MGTTEGIEAALKELRANRTYSVVMAMLLLFVLFWVYIQASEIRLLRVQVANLKAARVALEQTIERLEKHHADDP